MLTSAVRADDAVGSPIEALLSQTIQTPHTPPYAGDISPAAAYGFMLENESLLVDVRTLPEWQFVGIPDASATKANMLTVSWKLYPTFALNPEFLPAVVSETKNRKDLPIFFICRSGGRSLDAAVALTAQGYNYCFNISGGFEGEPNAQSHRGADSGWKASQLPWKQG
jgi:rhodanese-related sulfurtransferase